MKFAEHLAAHVTPEWTSQYIRYDDMKDILYALEQDAPKEGKYTEYTDTDTTLMRFLIKMNLH